MLGATTTLPVESVKTKSSVIAFTAPAFLASNRRTCDCVRNRSEFDLFLLHCQFGYEPFLYDFWEKCQVTVVPARRPEIQVQNRQVRIPGKAEFGAWMYPLGA